MSLGIMMKVGQQIQLMWGQKQDYLEKLLSKSPQKQKALQQAQAAQKVVMKDIKSGQQMISQSQTQSEEDRVVKFGHLDQQVTRKKDIIQRQMKDLDKEMKVNQQLLKKAKQQISIIRYASHEATKQYQEKKKKQIAKQVHKWTKEKQLMEKRHKIDQNKRQKKNNQREEKNKRQAQEREQFLKLEKRKQIEQRIKDIEVKRLQREQRVYEMPRSLSTHAVIPRYLVAQRNFRQKQLQKQFQLGLSRQKNKARAAIDPEQLKAHERAYVERIKQRFNKKAKPNDNDSSTKGQVKSEFDLYLNRKEQRTKEQLQKMRRRQKFQQKIAKIPLNVDQKKKIQRQINIDKAKNPYKYNFLAQKSLNDQQIFKQFKDFQMKQDPRKIGNDYLQKIKQEPRIRVSKSTMLKRSELPVSDRPTYKNYLDQVKVKRRQPGNEIQQMKRAYKKNPELAKGLLNKKSQDYEGKALKKIKQLQNSPNYEDSLVKQKQIDQMFVRSLQAKIAAVQFS